MAQNLGMPGIASFSPFDQADTGFDQVIEAIHAPAPKTVVQHTAPGKSRARHTDANSTSSRNGKAVTAARAKPDKVKINTAPVAPTSIDLTDPTQVALAMANYQRLNDGLHVMAARVAELEEHMSSSNEINASLEAQITELEAEIKIKDQMLEFVNTTGITAMKTVGLRCVQGAGAAFGAIVIVAWLLA